MEYVNNNLYFKVAETDSEIESAFRLRYKMYCQKKKWLKAENYPNQLEKDRYDSEAIHVLAYDSEFQLVGTLRFLKKANYDYLPYEKHPGLKKELDVYKNVAEISRFIVFSDNNQSGITNGLLRASYQVARHNGIDNCIFVLEPSLVRLVKRYHFYCEPIGTPSLYFGGFTMVTVCNIAYCESIWRKGTADVWKYYKSESIIQKDKVLA